MGILRQSLCDHKKEDIRVCTIKDLTGNEEKSIYCCRCGKIILDKKFYLIVNDILREES